MNELERTQLGGEWRCLIARFDSPPEVADAVFDDIVVKYSAADRAYHTLAHLNHMLGTISALADHALDLDSVKLAAWFHDAIYDSKASDNEERSAEYARPALAKMGVPVELIARVVDLILLTKTHQAQENDADAAVLLDADLAILGASADVYRAYAQAIRQEYAWVPEPDYRAGRRRVLDRFLERPRIFRTAPMHQTLEAQARQNLMREIAGLT